MLTSQRSDFLASSVAVTLDIQTLSMGWIKSVALTSQNQLMLSFDLVRVVTAGSWCDAHPLVVYIENKIVLAHQTASNQHL